MPRLLALGDAAWTVEFGSAIDPAIHARVMGLAESLVQQQRDADPVLAGIVDVVPTFRSLTVHFDPLVASPEALGERLLALAQLGATREMAGRRWHLPVCFDEAFAPDLGVLAEAKGLRPDDVVQTLLQAEFRVYTIGFQPGFAYLGGLPAALEMPRRATPRPRVPAQSLAVAGAMCAVYPWDSPGGWNLLGRMPVRMFDLRRAPQPALLSVGDRVRWQAVSRAAHDALDQQAQAGELDVAAFRVDAEGV
jgi:KipI family sensor histidine kinase inhibitor